MGSNYNNKFKIYKFVLQIIATAVGLSGLFIIVFISSIYITLLSATHKLVAEGLLVFNFILLIGIYFIYIAYCSLIRFSDEAIKHICACISIIIAVFLPNFISKIFHLSIPIEATIGLISIFIAIIFYVVTSKLLIKLWQESQH
jgi:hypothetical protein